MSAITSFNPVQYINSLIQPLGLVISNKQQIIAKTAILGLVVLSVSQGLPLDTVNEQYKRTACGDNCYFYSLPPFHTVSMFIRCLQSCNRH